MILAHLWKPASGRFSDLPDVTSLTTMLLSSLCTALQHCYLDSILVADSIVKHSHEDILDSIISPVDSDRWLCLLAMSSFGTHPAGINPPLASLSVLSMKLRRFSWCLLDGNML